jgi:hypothetical protein
MSVQWKGDVSERCEGPCSITYGHVEDFAGDVSIRAVTRAQLNVKTGEKIAGSGQNIDAQALDRELLARLRRYFNRFIYSRELCPPGCFCQGSGNTTVRQETINIPVTETRPEFRHSVWIPHDHGPLQDLIDKIKTGAETVFELETGAPYRFNDEVDMVGSTTLNCCGQIVLELEILHLFEYTLEVEARVELTTEVGTCEPLPEGGSVV